MERNWGPVSEKIGKCRKLNFNEKIPVPNIMKFHIILLTSAQGSILKVKIFLTVLKYARIRISNVSLMIEIGFLW